MFKSNQFTWDEFLDRFLVDHEEFRFWYFDKRIDISLCDREIIGLSYGNDEVGFLWKEYMTRYDFLEDPIFDGKTLMEIWNDIK